MSQPGVDVPDMRIVITGGAGFIGSNIADAYLALGHEVLIVDNLSSGLRANLPAAAKFAQVDMTTPEAAEVVKAFKPHVLNHHAAQIDVRRSVSDAKFDAITNIGGLLNVLDAARAGGELKRVVYAASGGSMYGDTAVMPTPETHSIGACSPYGVSKATCELYLQAYRAMYGLHYVALRYPNVYGPRQNPHGEAGVVAIFCERLLSGKPCTIFGDGGQTRDFLHVSDVVSANVKALTTDFVGGVNLGTATEVTITQVYEGLAKAAGVSATATYAPGKPGEQRRSVLTNELAKRALDWSPAFDISRGLADTIAWYRRSV